MQLLLVVVAEEHICGTMSVLTPVLQPPEVKEYLSKGERFIKWDDVSTRGLAALASVGGGCADTIFWGDWERIVVTGWDRESRGAWMETNRRAED